MSKLLRTGLTLLGVGVLSVGGMCFSKWGPCGPSSITGLIFLLSAGVCFTLACLFLVVSFFKFLVQKARESSTA